MSTADVNTLCTVAGAVGWGIFGVVWIVGWIYGRSRGPGVAHRSVFGSGGLYIALVGVVLYRVVPHWPATGAIGVHVAGVVVLAVGVAICLWARATLGLMWSAVPEVRESHELRTAGPYAWVRHPIYTGLLGMLIGTMLLAGGGVFLMVVPVALVVFEFKLRVEERLMVETFPDAYPRYRARVPQLVPYRIPRRDAQEADRSTT